MLNLEGAGNCISQIQHIIKCKKIGRLIHYCLFASHLLFLGERADKLECAIQGRGAFRRFKDMVDRMGISQQWYDF